MKSILPRIVALALSAVLPTMVAADTPGRSVRVEVKGFVSPEYVKTSMAKALSLTSYARPAELPNVLIVNEDALRELAGIKNPLVRIYGLVIYDHPDTVLVSATTPVKYQTAVLVHELVHVLQALANPGKELNCLEASARELEAHAVGVTVLNELHPGVRYTSPDFSCPGTEP